MIQKNLLSCWSALLVASLVSGTGYASDKVCDPKDAKSCIQPVSEGDTVPFSGQLVTHRRAAKLVANLEQCNEEKALSLEEAAALFQVKLDLANEQRLNDGKFHKMQMELMVKRMGQMADDLSVPWYQSPPFVAVSSVLLTGAVFVVAVKTVEALR